MTMDRSYGTDVLANLASLVASTRVACGHAAWDIAGIRTALHRAAIRPGTTTIAQLAHAALAVAADPTARTPMLLANDGPWWNATGMAPVLNLYRRPTGRECVTCSLPEDACRARDGGHPFDPRPKPKAPMPVGLLDISND